MQKLKRVFSGIQPTGSLHLGNYLGAINNWRDLVENYDTIFCAVDLHTLTVPENFDPTKTRTRVHDTIALYVACGIDPNKSTLFVQSHVKEHTELTWILNCVTPIGWLERMTQYKSKSETFKSVGMGLLDYPVLMAADILLYDTELVPVGDDQKQHIELAREIAQRFNHLYGDTFIIPNPMISKEGARIMGLDDPSAKMSKSLAATRKGHMIALLDDEKTLRKSIMSSVTDSKSAVDFGDLSPGVDNLLTIHQLLRKCTRDEQRARFSGKGYGVLKTAVFEAVLDTLRPIQTRYQEITADPTYLDALLAKGATRAQDLAQKTMARVKSNLGLI